MTTIKEYLSKKYPTNEEKEREKEIIVMRPSRENNFPLLDGGELDLSEYPNLETL